jgi:hypothetical protein
LVIYGDPFDTDTKFKKAVDGGRCRVHLIKSAVWISVFGVSVDLLPLRIDTYAETSFEIGRKAYTSLDVAC